mmetsp:Transcript_47707/g.139026  ORF Transcript_47707/g.139026 Transcript_47707/m.139026 type:complete len:262 (+) Transcript_47707:93-878(+)
MPPCREDSNLAYSPPGSMDDSLSTRNSVDSPTDDHGGNGIAANKAAAAKQTSATPLLVSMIWPRCAHAPPKSSAMTAKQYARMPTKTAAKMTGPRGDASDGGSDGRSSGAAGNVGYCSAPTPELRLLPPGVDTAHSAGAEDVGLAAKSWHEGAAYALPRCSLSLAGVLSQACAHRNRSKKTWFRSFRRRSTLQSPTLGSTVSCRSKAACLPTPERRASSCVRRSSPKSCSICSRLLRGLSPVSHWCAASPTNAPIWPSKRL